MNYLLLSVIFLVNSFSFSLGYDPHVKISGGELQGSFLKSRGDKTYSAFLGVPYAKPPKRFQLAELPEPWTGIREATKFGEMCVQKNNLFGPGEIVGSENCLFANVYVPGKMTKKNLPVMVFIHGGGFVAGLGDMYGANYIMDQDVVLVTINYRLGALGFLSSGDDGVIEGNLGLKDQHLALKWVQKEIKAFGGDPKKITIFGESAGAASVHYHVLSPLSKDLFQHAIIQSGAAISPWAYTDNPSKNAFKLGNSLGCSSDSSSRLLECLNEKSAEEIMSFEIKEWYVDPVIIFPPTHDSKKSKLNLIPENPIKLLESGDYNKIPVLFTMCKDEGLAMHSAVVSRTETLRKEINEEFKRVLPTTLFYSDGGLSKSQKDVVSSQVKKFYFADKYIGQGTLTNLTNMYTDRWFMHSIQKSAHLHAKHSTVYSALLSYQGEHSILTIFGINEILGVAHADDLQYLFNGGFTPNAVLNSKDENISKLIVSTFTNFATTGKPEFKDLKWMPFSTRVPTWFNLDSRPEILENPFKERFEFWDKIWGKVHKDEL